MQLINNKLKRYKWNFVLQLILTGAFLFGVFFALGAASESDLLSAIGISALSASTLIAFFMPDIQTAQTPRIVGGYAAGILSGVLWHLLIPVVSYELGTGSSFYALEIAAVMAVTTTIFLMVLFKLEHPPAVGFSLGLVLEYWSTETLLIVFLAAATLSTVKYLLRDVIKNVV